jgi:hypothetical protein
MKGDILQATLNVNVVVDIKASLHQTPGGKRMAKR